MIEVTYLQNCCDVNTWPGPHATIRLNNGGDAQLNFVTRPSRWLGHIRSIHLLPHKLQSITSANLFFTGPYKAANCLPQTTKTSTQIHGCHRTKPLYN